MTADLFFDLFLLCLYWQSMRSNNSRPWTTVDHVLRILNGMKILSDQSRRELRNSRRLYALFRMRSRFLPPDITYVPSGGKDVHVLKLPSMLVVQIPGSHLSQINPRGVLRHYRIMLTYRGTTVAQSFEGRHRAVITKHRYLLALKRLNLEGAEKLRRIRAYQGKVVRELAQDEEEVRASANNRRRALA